MDLSRDDAFARNGALLQMSCVKAVATLELIEESPRDKYLPSFLSRGEVPEFAFHALVAAGLEGDNATRRS